MKKISVRHIALILLFFVVLGVVLYPTISNKWNERVTSRAIDQFDEAIDEMDKAKKEKVAQTLKP